MPIQTSSHSSPTSAAFRLGLTAATRTVRRMHLLAAVRDAISPLACSIAATAFGCAGLDLASRILPHATVGVPPLALIGAVIGLVLALGVIVRAAMVVPAGWDVAERLDLSLKSRNAIATALDLLASGDHSAFGLLAIEEGLHAVNQTADPVPPARKAIQRRPILLAASGIALLLLCRLIPRNVASPGIGLAPTRTQPADPRRVELADASALTTDTAGFPPPPPRPAPLPIAASKGESFSDTDIANTTAGSMPAAGNVGNTAQARASGSSAASAVASAQGGAQGGAPPRLTTPSQPAGFNSEKKSPDDASKAPDPASANAAAGGSAASTPSANASSPTAAPAQSAAARASGDTARSGDAKDSEDSNSSGRSGKSGRPGHSSSGAPDGGASGPTNGQSGGQDAPKKSRGVAPLMLGTPVPDLLHGPTLPGPERRTTSKAPPQASPDTPAADTALQSRTNDEAPVDAFPVPADRRASVNRYFQKFHQDADQTTDPAR